MKLALQFIPSSTMFRIIVLTGTLLIIPQDDQLGKELAGSQGNCKDKPVTSWVIIHVIEAMCTSCPYKWKTFFRQSNKIKRSLYLTTLLFLECDCFDSFMSHNSTNSSLT